MTTRLSYTEAAAVLAQALRLARFTEQSYRAAMLILDRLWDEFEVVEVDDRTVRRAAQLAYTCALRGYDAVHCSSAEQLDDSDVVVLDVAFAKSTRRTSKGPPLFIARCRRFGRALREVVDVYPTPLHCRYSRRT